MHCRKLASLLVGLCNYADSQELRVRLGDAARTISSLQLELKSRNANTPAKVADKKEDVQADKYQAARLEHVRCCIHNVVQIT